MPPIGRTPKLSNRPLKFKNRKSGQRVVFPLHPDNMRKTGGYNSKSSSLNLNINGKPLLLAIFIILLVCILSALIFHKNAMAIMVDGKAAGYIKTTSVTEDEMNSLVTAKLKEDVGNDIQLNEKITLKPVNSLFKKVYSNPETVITDVCKQVTFKQKATSIDIQKKSYVIVSNLEAAKEVTQTVLKNYKSTDGTTEPQFAIQIGTSDVFVENSEVSSIEDAVAKLSETKAVTREYTVASGDTFASIAAKAGMTEAELLQANPSVTDKSKISLGQKLKVTFNERVVPIRTFKTTTEKVSIPYETERVANRNEDEDYWEETQEGVNGEKEVSKKIPYINGVQAGEPVTTEKVTKQPVTRRIEYGTRSYSYDDDDEDDE